MNWKALKNNACPKCESKLLRTPLSDTYECSENTCTFSVTAQRFDEIINDMYKPKVRRCGFEDNFSSLNNFGHKKVAEDFSDSKFLDR